MTKKIELVPYPPSFEKLTLDDLHVAMIKSVRERPGLGKGKPGTGIKLAAGKERKRYCKKHGLQWPEDKSKRVEDMNMKIYGPSRRRIYDG